MAISQTRSSRPKLTVIEPGLNFKLLLLKEKVVAEIIDFEEKRQHIAAKRGFRSWSNRFPENFSVQTCSRDLTDATLGALIQTGQESNRMIYEFIMGVKGLGLGPRFHFLNTTEKMQVMDMTIFLLDQLRFECMRRLGWIETYLTYDTPLVSIVEEYVSRFSSMKHYTPDLSPAHPRYSEYEGSFEGDRGAFVRRMIPEAIEAFEQQRQKGKGDK